MNSHRNDIAEELLALRAGGVDSVLLRAVIAEAAEDGEQTGTSPQPQTVLALGRTLLGMSQERL